MSPLRRLQASKIYCIACYQASISEEQAATSVKGALSFASHTMHPLDRRVAVRSNLSLLLSLPVSDLCIWSHCLAEAMPQPLQGSHHGPGRLLHRLRQQLGNRLVRELDL